MSTTRFEDYESENEEYTTKAPEPPEASPSKKLERRRKIEDLFEEKRLREELGDFEELI